MPKHSLGKETSRNTQLKPSLTQLQGLSLSPVDGTKEVLPVNSQTEQRDRVMDEERKKKRFSFKQFL